MSRFSRSDCQAGRVSSVAIRSSLVDYARRFVASKPDIGCYPVVLEAEPAVLHSIRSTVSARLFHVEPLSTYLENWKGADLVGWRHHQRPVSSPFDSETAAVVDAPIDSRSNWSWSN
jgi:hypothetical protein